MISAFGIDHGEISKALKPSHLDALERVAHRRPIKNINHTLYAVHRKGLNNLKTIPHKYHDPKTDQAGVRAAGRRISEGEAAHPEGNSKGKLADLTRTLYRKRRAGWKSLNG